MNSFLTMPSLRRRFSTRVSLRTVGPSLAFFCAAMLVVLDAAPQTPYPAKPIRIVVPSAPGDGSDLTSRILADKLAAALATPVVVENKLGAGGVVGTEYAAHQPADGYTLIMGNAGSHAINAALYGKLSYDPARDFTAVALVGISPNLMAVHPAVPVRSVAEFIAYAKANPGALHYASGGNGSSAHLSAELFKTMTGVHMEHIPYKGATPALTDLIAGQVEVMIANLSPMLPHAKAGRIRALAVTTSTRYAGLPEVPTVAESGLPGYETVAWFGLFAPAGTPREVVVRLNREVNAILAEPDVRERLLAIGLEPKPGSPDDFASRQTADIAKWKKVVADSGAKVD